MSQGMVQNFQLMHEILPIVKFLRTFWIYSLRYPSLGVHLSLLLFGALQGALMA